MADFDILYKVLIASFLSMLIGLEREKANKAAGLRTNLIVGGFTCLTILLAEYLVESYSETSVKNSIVFDPIRVIQAIIIGISFIGAGTIIKNRKGSEADSNEIKGLTTAATLLFSCGIGIAIALEFYILAVSITIFIFLSNIVFRYLENKYMD